MFALNVQLIMFTNVEELNAAGFLFGGDILKIEESKENFREN